MLTPTYPGGNVTVSCRHDGGLCERVITHLLPKENEIVGLGAQTHEEVLAIPRVRICRLLLGASQTTGPYNLLCLPPEPGHDMTLCVLFRPTVIVPQTLRCFHGNGSIVGFLGALKRAFRSRDQGFDLVHAHSTHVAVLYLLFSWFCGTSRIPTVFTLHTSYGNLDLKHKLMLIPILFWFSRVVFCSHASRDSLPRFLLRLTGNRSRVVTNGVDLARVDSTLNQMDISEHKDGFRIVTVGRLIHLKMLQVLLEAFARLAHSEAVLTFVGEGADEERLRATSEEMGVATRVVFTGLVPREQVYGILALSDLFVSTSSREGMPVAVLEAMACGVPTILSDIPPHREIAGQADFIPLIEVGNVERLAQAIDQVALMSPSERTRIGRRCRELVENRFSVTAMRRGYDRVFAEIAAGRSHDG